MKVYKNQFGYTVRVLEQEVIDSWDYSNEKWLPVVGFEDLYEISSMGRVRSKERMRKMYCYRKGESGGWTEGTVHARIMKLRMDFGGYMNVEFHKDSKPYRFKVHVLVAQAFCPNKDDTKVQVDHINALRNDNRVENLRWVTRSENLSSETAKKHMSAAQKKNYEEHPEYFTGLNRKDYKASEETRKLLSIAHKGIKPSVETIEKRRASMIRYRVLQYDLDGNMIKRWDCVSAVMTANPTFSEQTLRKKLNIQDNFYKGYIWKKEPVISI